MDSFDSANSKRIAAEVGVDSAVFDKCLDQGRVQKYVDSDFALGRTMDVVYTPFFFISGRPVSGLVELAAYEQIIEEELGSAAHTEIDDSGSAAGECSPGEDNGDCE